MRSDAYFMGQALEEARKGLREGGLPIGAVLVADGEIVGRGHNQRVQAGDPTAHGDIDCLRNAASHRGSHRGCHAPFEK